VYVGERLEMASVNFFACLVVVGFESGCGCVDFLSFLVSEYPKVET
jgi:hypothetical protein